MHASIWWPCLCWQILYWHFYFDTDIQHGVLEPAYRLTFISVPSCIHARHRVCPAFPVAHPHDLAKAVSPAGGLLSVQVSRFRESHSLVAEMKPTVNCFAINSGHHWSWYCFQTLTSKVIHLKTLDSGLHTPHFKQLSQITSERPFTAPLQTLTHATERVQPRLE